MQYVYNIAFGMLQLGKNEISLRQWSGGTAHLRTSEGTCFFALRHFGHLSQLY